MNKHLQHIGNKAYSSPYAVIFSCYHEGPVCLSAKSRDDGIDDFDEGGEWEMMPTGQGDIYFNGGDEL